jgi:hypothetical protein
MNFLRISARVHQAGWRRRTDVNVGLSGWLNPSRLNKQQLENLLNAKEILYYVHQIAA